MSENANLSQADMHKGSGVAVVEGKWYIGECKPTKERTIRSALEKASYEVYVFIRTTEAELWNILLTYPSIYRFMINKAASDREKGKRVFAYVPDAEMQQLRYVLNNAPNPVQFTTKELSLGQQIEVMRGPLIGLKGELARIENTTYIVLKMEMGERNYVFTEIPVQDVRPV